MKKIEASKGRAGLRVALCCAWALLMLCVAASDEATGNIARAESNALCALLPSGSDFEARGVDNFDGSALSCQVYDRRSGDANKFFFVSVESAGSSAAARSLVESYANEPGWNRVDGLGDVAFEHPSAPGAGGFKSEYAQLVFARNCYRFYGDAGSIMLGGPNIKYNDLSEVRSIASAVDGGVSSLPCGDSPGGPGGPTPDGSNPPTATATGEPPTATATPTADADLEVDHIEVVQVLQTRDNQIPLVAGKKTVVRAFLKAETDSGDPGPFVTFVSAYIWPEGKSEVELKAAPPLMLVKAGSAPDRKVTDSSVNFVIPPDMASVGVFSLRVVVNPDHGLPETDYENNELTEPFEFVQRNGLRVGYVRIGYRPPFESTFSWPGANLAKYDPLLRKLLPAPEAGVQYYEMPWRVRATRSASSYELGEDLNLYLREFYEQLTSDKPDILIGWLDSKYTSGFEYGGLAETVTPGQLGRVAIVLDYQGPYSEETLAHEIGHDLGLKHTATTGDPNPPCRLSYNGDSGYWPSEYMNSAAIRELGFDTVSMQVVPGNRYDIMSYCSPDPWITPFHYRKLFDQNVKPAQEYQGSTIGNILVRGWGWVRGGGGAPRFELVRPADSGGGSPRYTARSSPYESGFGFDFADSLLFAGARRSVTMQSEGTGDYCMRFLDAGGQGLYERCFEPSFVDAESFEPIEEAGFVLSVPDPGDFVRVVLIHKDGGAEQEITAIEAGAPPAVMITSPESGDRWEGEQTIEWTGSDADGDELRYDIQYSADGKVTWYPLEVRSYETSYTFSTDEILPSDQTYIRVLASDGFDTAHADVGPITIPRQPNSPEPPPPLPSLADTTGTSGNGPGSLPGGMNVWALVAAGGVGLLLILGIFAIVRRKPQPQPAQWAGQPPYANQMPPVQPPGYYAQPQGTAQPPGMLTCPYPDCVGPVAQGQYYCGTCGRSLDPEIVASVMRAMERGK